LWRREGRQRVESTHPSTVSCHRPWPLLKRSRRAGRWTVVLTGLLTGDRPYVSCFPWRSRPRSWQTIPTTACLSASACPPDSCMDTAHRADRLPCRSAGERWVGTPLACGKTTQAFSLTLLSGMIRSLFRPHHRFYGDLLSYEGILAFLIVWLQSDEGVKQVWISRVAIVIVEIILTRPTCIGRVIDAGRRKRFPGPECVFISARPAGSGNGERPLCFGQKRRQISCFAFGGGRDCHPKLQPEQRTCRVQIAVVLSTLCRGKISRALTQRQHTHHHKEPLCFLLSLNVQISFAYPNEWDLFPDKRRGAPSCVAPLGKHSSVCKDANVSHSEELPLMRECGEQEREASLSRHIFSA
jgi:hypothetical protein